MYLLTIVFGIIQSLLISYILYIEIKKKSPAVFLWGTLMVMFGIPHLLASFLGDNNYSSQIINDASIFVIGFGLLYLFFRSKERFTFVSLQNSKFQMLPSPIEGSFFEKICFGIFLFSIIGLIINIIVQSGGVLNTSWTSVRASVNENVGFAALAGRLVFAFSGFSLFFFLTKRKIKALLVTLLFLFLVVLTRNRVQILPILIFLLTLYLLKMNTITFKHIVVSGTLIVAIIYLIYAIRAFRYLGSLSTALSEVSLEYINDTVINFINSQNGELGLRRDFYYFIHMDNNFEDFNLGNTYIRMLFVFLPMQWSFGIKPRSFDLSMGQALGAIQGGSVHPTLFGDCFGNLYWFGIFLGVFWALLANFIDWQISKQKYSFFKIMIYFLASYAFVVIGRGSVYNGFQVYAWGVLILIVFKKFFLSFIKVRFSFGKISGIRF